MAYARISNGTVAEYPIHIGEIQLRFPNTSFPIPFSPPDGYVEIEDASPPDVDYTKVLTEGVPKLVNGRYIRNWRVENAPPEVMAERDKSKADSVRSIRNNLLVKTDWTQLPDSPVDRRSWATYRQNLRDLPNQPGFPWNVIWPKEPTQLITSTPK